ncbi:MAG: hypothetical protein K2I12_05330 [Duncaniella sp.]|nr:hypothetical protein [Duncaniella sp.]
MCQDYNCALSDAHLFNLSDSGKICIFADMQTFLPVILSILILAISSCTSRSGKEAGLDRAETLVDSLPTEALAILDSIAVDSTDPASIRARHALLTSIAFDKSYIDLTTDSIINIALDYYSCHPKDINNVKALYYRGRIEENKCDINKAIHYYVKAESNAKEIGSHFWLGRIYTRIRALLCSTFSGQEALKFAKMAHNEYVLSEASEYIPHSAYEVAMSYANVLMYDKAINVADSLLLAINQDELPELRNYILSLLGTSHFALCNYEESVNIYDRLYDDNDTVFYNNDRHVMMTLYSMMNMDDKSSLLEESKHDNMNSEIPAYEYLYKQGRYKEAYDALMILTDSTDAIFVNLQRQAVSNILLINRETEIFNKNITLEQTRQRFYLIFILLIVAILSATVIVYTLRKTYELKEMNLRLKSDAYMSQVSTLLEEKEVRDFKLRTIVDEKNSIEQEQAKLLERIHILVADKYYVIDDLVSSYYLHYGQKNEQKKITDKIKKYISDISLKGKELRAIEEHFNIHCNNVFKNLRSEPANLSDIDIALAIYIASKFSTNTICLLLDEKVDVIYNRKSRLKRKLNALNTPDSKLLLKLMD